MTFEEAIARERYLAEIYRNDIVPKEDYHNMPWIDMENESNMRIAKEHEQLAEWLEELKAIKDGSIPIIHGKAELELHDKVIRNEAIDEFARKLHKGCIEMIKQTWGSNIAPLSWAEAYANFKVDIDEIAEKLKEQNR